MDEVRSSENIPTIRVDDLKKSFGRLDVLHGISLEARNHDVISILGSSGSGKSTFLRCINLLETPSSGRVFVEGEEIEFERSDNGRIKSANAKQAVRLRANLGMVFQSFNLWSHMTVLENVMEGPVQVLGLSKSDARLRAQDCLEKVGVYERKDFYPSQISGGQQQRCAIARALAMEPRALLFDEPTSALDPELVGEVLKVMRGLAEEGRTMLVVTHEMGFARDVSNKVMVLHKGLVEAQGTPQELFSNPKEHPRDGAILSRKPGINRRQTGISTGEETMKNIFKPTAVTLALAIGATAASAEDLVIRWGTEAGYKPFAYKTADGALTGFDIEIGNAICEELNATCSWSEHEFDALIAALNARKFDALLASMTDTDKRRRAIDFTGRYYQIPATYVGRADAGLDDGEGLAGKTVGVQRSTIMEDYLRSERKDVEVKTYPTQDEIWLDLVSGRLDAAMGVKLQIVEGFLNTDQGKGFVLFGQDYTDPKYFGYGSAIGMRKSDAELRDAISGAILALRENGKYAEINNKYFDFDIYGD